MRAFVPFLVLFCIRLAPGMAFQSVAIASPLMISALGLSQGQAGLALGAFSLPGVVVCVAAGMLARRIGDTPVLLSGLALVGAGALLASLAPSYAVLVLARVVSGAGGVAVLMLSIKMTADRYAGPWLSTASAMILTSWPAGLALGLLLFAPVPAAFGWRITLALAGLPALLAILLVPSVGNARRPAVQAAGASGVSDAPPPRPFVVGAVTTWALINAVLTTVIGFLPAYLLALGMGLKGAAAAASLAAWSSAIAIPLGGLLADRWWGRRIAVIGGLIASAAALLVIATGAVSPLALVGFGIAFSAAPGPLTAQFGQAIPPSGRAVAFGWYSACSFTGMTVAPWLAGWLRDAAADARMPLLFCAVLCLVALLPYIVMLRWQPGEAGAEAAVMSVAR